MQSDNIEIVLVNPSHPGNIGATARAMKTMGLSRLCLVAPRQFPDEQALWRAAAAADVLEQARVVQSMEEAIADAAFVVGTSARDRRIPWPALDPRRCAQRIAEVAQTQKVVVLFGRENRGLSNDELKLCHLHLYIPSAPEYTSLNLAMAVQIVCYELRMLALAETLPASATAHWDAPLAVQGELERLYAHFEQTLSALGFLNPAAPRQLMQRLRRLYSRAQPDVMEVNILRGILSTTDKWIDAALGKGPLPPLPDTVARTRDIPARTAATKDEG